MIRAFIALPVEEAARSALRKVIDELRPVGMGDRYSVRWVERDNIHLTLKFLNSIDGQQIKRVTGAMDTLKGMKAFRIELHTIGAFPSLARPRVLWIGIEQQEQVKALFDKLEVSIHDLNGEDRPFTAHITIGRVNGTVDNQGLEKIIKVWDDILISSSFVDRVVLFQSILGSKGAVYRSLYTVDLNKEAL